MPGKAEEKSFGKADEVRVFPKGKVELVTIGGATIGRATLEPGWRWSSSVQPIAKTKSCEAPHFQYHVAGTLKVVMDDGTELVCKPGDVSLLPSGHDAWGFVNHWNCCGSAGGGGPTPSPISFDELHKGRMARGIPCQQRLCDSPFSPRKSRLFARGLPTVRTLPIKPSPHLKSA